MDTVPGLFGKNNGGDNSLADISLGMHIAGDGTTRPVYFLLRSLIAAAAVFGSVFCFITACAGSSAYQFSPVKSALAAAVGWAYFSISFALCERRPVLSRYLSCGGIIALMIFGLIRLGRISAGVMNAANLFMASLFSKYAAAPVFTIAAVNARDGSVVSIESCTDEAMIFFILLICAVVCFGTVKRPNILPVFGATFPLPELCLYFGLVPNYAAFALLIASWCGALAAEITEFGAFADKSSRSIFSKTSAQSASAAAAIMLLSFAGASLYAADFVRPESADSFRTGFTRYMETFSWQKFTEDVKDAFLPADNKNITHDGKLGNVESVEFTGHNMLEVTLPEDSGTMYLKGFTGTDYTGSRWNEGPALPPLDTKITSPEFFSGRTLKYIPEYRGLRSKDVIVRSTGISSSVKYYPVNAAGLLETDGRRRKYGVYFPPDDWRSVVIESADNIKLPSEMAGDEEKLRAYAERYCLDVPDTFTAAADFFADYDGNSLYDELKYIRKTLADKCEYSLDAGKKPFGSDFVQWFLTDNKKGSCTHFASAAVLLCRSRGIPARYCEGFIIKSEDIADFAAVDGYVTVSVPDSRAHAWAEVYIDGYGWLSFEATPGYGNISAVPDDALSGEVTSEITSVSTEPPVYSESVPNVSSTVTAAGTDISGESTIISTQVSAEEGTGEISLTVTSDVPHENGNAAAGAQSSDSDISESSASQTSVPEEFDTDSSGSSSVSEYFSEPDRSDSKAAKTIASAAVVFGIIAAAAALLYLRRRIIFALRRRQTERYPERAAADIYRMLISLAEREDIAVAAAADNIAAQLAETGRFDEPDCDNIVKTALKARFGGGISSEEALSSADSYRKLAEALNGESAFDKIVSTVIYCSDKYI